MLQPLKVLVTHLHILVVSVLVVALSLGMLSSPISVKSPSASTSKRQTHVQLPTASVGGDNSQGSISAASTPIMASGGLVEAQSEPSQSKSMFAANPPVDPSPVMAVPLPTCTPCGATSDCTSACPAPQQPTPVPPISGGCDVCGGSTYQPHTMCPMYCLESAE